MTSAPQGDAVPASLPRDVDPARTAFFLDFDGTLVAIAPRPDDVVLKAGTRRALERLAAAADGALAIVSGRALSDLDRHLGQFLAPAVGAHGAEIRRVAGGKVETLGDATPLAERYDVLRRFADKNDLLLEKKAGAITVHFRSRPELERDAVALIERLTEGEPSLRAFVGNKVAEIGLAGIDKGSAVAALMEQAPFAGRTPLVAGDDTTDEDAFAEVRRRGGVAIKVGPGETAATYRAEDHPKFLDWLIALADRAAAAEVPS